MNNLQQNPHMKIWLYLMVMILVLIYGQLNTIKWMLRDSDDYRIINAEIISSNSEYQGAWSKWQVIVRYEYQVDGEIFQSVKTHGFATEEQSSVYAQKYFSGKNIDIYYRIASPSISVFEPESVSFKTLYILVFLILSSVIFLIYALRSNNKP